MPKFKVKFRRVVVSECIIEADSRLALRKRISAEGERKLARGAKVVLDTTNVAGITDESPTAKPRRASKEAATSPTLMRALDILLHRS